MRVLIISFYFPPFNSIGAVRVGKHAKYLERAGHEVRVITARQQFVDRTLPLEIPAEHVFATQWINLNRPVEAVLGGPAAVTRTGYIVPDERGIVSGAAKTLGRVYKSLFHLPDGQIGWYLYAIREARRLFTEWTPEVIYASSPPVTSLLVAAAVSRTSGIPWFGELRDLWLDNANRQFGPLRNWLEGPVERRVFASARGLITVSEPLAEKVRRKTSRPVCVVLNGFDPLVVDAEPIVESLDSTIVQIVYTGRVYGGKQDPSPLFKALKQLGDDADRVRVTFVGRYLDGIHAQAHLHGVVRCVQVLDPVPYPTALKMQRDADALLLLLWTDSKETGVFTGKLFEYVGARRPILAIGASQDVASDLILERGLGTVSADSMQIAAQLREWINTKDELGYIPAPPSMTIDDLSREAQTMRLAEFFEVAMRSGLD